MSPRRNRPRDSKPTEPPEHPIVTDLAIAAPPGWQVKVIQPHRALKEYRCPGCNQEVRPATLHVVAWRDGNEPDRRHWHRPCWQRHTARGV